MYLFIVFFPINSSTRFSQCTLKYHIHFQTFSLFVVNHFLIFRLFCWYGMGQLILGQKWILPPWVISPAKHSSFQRGYFAGVKLPDAGFWSKWVRHGAFFLGEETMRPSLMMFLWGMMGGHLLGYFSFVVVWWDPVFQRNIQRLFLHPWLIWDGRDLSG